MKGKKSRKKVAWGVVTAVTSVFCAFLLSISMFPSQSIAYVRESLEGEAQVLCEALAASDGDESTLQKIVGDVAQSALVANPEDGKGGSDKLEFANGKSNKAKTETAKTETANENKTEASEEIAEAVVEEAAAEEAAVEEAVAEAEAEVEAEAEAESADEPSSFIEELIEEIFGPSEPEADEPSYPYEEEFVVDPEITENFPVNPGAPINPESEEAKGDSEDTEYKDIEYASGEGDSYYPPNDSDIWDACEVQQGDPW